VNHQQAILSRASRARETASIERISEQIVRDGEASWKLWLFEFVDEFRRNPSADLIAGPLHADLSPRVRCLLASTVESLCAECHMAVPARLARTQFLVEELFGQRG